jgi:DNA-binding helix-hairpin-helix protein with protein kinase domain
MGVGAIPTPIPTPPLTILPIKTMTLWETAFCEAVKQANKPTAAALLEGFDEIEQGQVFRIDHSAEQIAKAATDATICDQILKIARKGLVGIETNDH